MFWKKKSTTGEPNQAEKLPGPKGIPELIGRYIVVALKQDPDWVWKLKCVLYPHPESGDIFDFRVFDEVKTSQSNVKIINYKSFNEHPDLMLYEGWFNKKSMEVQVKNSRK